MHSKRFAKAVLRQSDLVGNVTVETAQSVENLSRRVKVGSGEFSTGYATNPVVDLLLSN
jgi:hypothetical protein